MNWVAALPLHLLVMVGARSAIVSAEEQPQQRQQQQHLRSSRDLQTPCPYTEKNQDYAYDVTWMGQFDPSCEASHFDYLNTVIQSAMQPTNVDPQAGVVNIGGTCVEVNNADYIESIPWTLPSTGRTRNLAVPGLAARKLLRYFRFFNRCTFCRDDNTDQRARRELHDSRQRKQKQELEAFRKRRKSLEVLSQRRLGEIICSDEPWGDEIPHVPDTDPLEPPEVWIFVEPVYSIDEPILVSYFNSFPITGDRLGIYRKEDAENLDSLDEPLMWVYACGDVSDQTNRCEVTVNNFESLQDGMFDFGGDILANGADMWPLPENNYVAVIIRDTMYPFKGIGKSNPFAIFADYYDDVTIVLETEFALAMMTELWNYQESLTSPTTPAEICIKNSKLIASVMMEPATVSAVDGCLNR